MTERLHIDVGTTAEFELDAGVYELSVDFNLLYGFAPIGERPMFDFNVAPHTTHTIELGVPARFKMTALGEGPNLVGGGTVTLTLQRGTN